MKTFTITILMLLFTFLNSEARKVEGRIILNNNDTMYVTFNIPVNFLSGTVNFERLQYRVKYYGNDGKTIFLRPDDALEIQFRYPDEEVRMLSRKNTLGDKLFLVSRNIFLKLEKDGDLKLFSYYFTRSSPGSYNASTGTMSPGYYYGVERYIFQIGTGELKRPRTLFFRKDMLEYLKGCPSLCEKIEKKDFGSNDVESIVDYYNKYCKEKSE